MFKVGDIITGLTEEQYSITNSFGTYEVVEILGTLIRVKILTHNKYTNFIGEIYPVNPKKFQPYDPQAAVLKKIAHLRNLFENRKQA